jgi:aminopeptidase YwaD
MVYFHDYPDVTIHTNPDVPENLDATKLGRVAYMGAGIAWTLAALPESEQDRMYDLAFADATARIARRATAANPSLATQEAVAMAVSELESVARLWPSTADAVAEETAQLRAQMSPAARPPDPRVPIRNPEIQGPLDVYYFDYLKERLVDPSKTALASREDGALLAYEALNLADGRRSLSEIRDALSARYAYVSLSAVSEYFEMLARAGAVRLP